LASDEPDFPSPDGHVSWRWRPAGAALAHEWRVGQVVIVDRCVEDGAEQAQVGVDGRGSKTVGEQLSIPGADSIGVQHGKGEVAKGRKDLLFDAFADVVGRVRMLSAPGRLPHIGDMVTEQRLCLGVVQWLQRDMLESWGQASLDASAGSLGCLGRPEMPAERWRLPSW